MSALKSEPRLVVFACGNPSRADDALGPLLFERLRALQLPSTPALVNDFQLQIEHAVDLANSNLALFLDASVSCAPPFDFCTLSATRDSSYTSHALSPAALLWVYERAYAQPAPPAFALTIRGQDFRLGEGLSAAANAGLEAAWEFLQGLVTDPRPERWQHLAAARQR